MIEIEILKTTNNDRQGSYKIYQNQLTIGSNIKNYIYLPEDDLPDSTCQLTIKQNKLFISFNESNFQYHLNKKICKISKSLKINDEIQLSNTRIKIINFIEETVITRKEFLNSKVQEIGKDDHELVNFIQELSK